MLGYWRELDRNLNVMAAQYYTALRAIEEQQEGKYIELYRGRGYEGKRKGRTRGEVVEGERELSSLVYVMCSGSVRSKRNGKDEVVEQKRENLGSLRYNVVGGG